MLLPPLCLSLPRLDSSQQEKLLQALLLHSSSCLCGVDDWGHSCLLELLDVPMASRVVGQRIREKRNTAAVCYSKNICTDWAPCSLGVGAFTFKIQL